MKTIDVIRKDQLKGKLSIFSFKPDGTITQLIHHKNMIMDGAAECVANLFLGKAQYSPAAIYFEYVNLADPGDSPVPPTPTPDEGIEYYTGLEYSYDTDFLRVPLIAAGEPTLLYNGNYMTSYYAVTPGSDVGFWGKPFTAAANSAVYGGALVASPIPDSQANDIVIARSYPAGAKILKPTGEQICIVWNIEVMLPQS